jgi:hypothetical protein
LREQRNDWRKKLRIDPDATVLIRLGNWPKIIDTLRKSVLSQQL